MGYIEGISICRGHDVGYIEGIPTCREHDGGYMDASGCICSIVVIFTFFVYSFILLYLSLLLY